jgi:hypothetical protein
VHEIAWPGVRAPTTSRPKRRRGWVLLLAALPAAAGGLWWRHLDSLRPIVPELEPRVVRVTLEAPTIVTPRPAVLPARPPRNQFEEALAPYGRWVHPIPDDKRWLPFDDSVRFGALRGGHREERCGRGHCGVDLAAPRSSPILAIGDGVIERVEKDRRDRAGWYVTVAHDDGRVVSRYMHLDFIRDDLSPGVAVRAGEWLGSLGRTGVRESDPHLHFEVQVRLSKRREKRVDPEPLLRAARVLDLLEMDPGVEPQASDGRIGESSAVAGRPDPSGTPAGPGKPLRSPARRDPPPAP